MNKRGKIARRLSTLKKAATPQGKMSVVTSHVLFLTIPCAVDIKPERNPPTYIVKEVNGKVVSAVWKCPWCGFEFLRRKPCCKHMGKIMNVPASCKLAP